MNRRIFVPAILFFAALSPSNAQTTSTSASTYKKGNKGKMYIFWGWNRGHYTKSDIHFFGDNYDFVLSDVVARDRQTPFSFDVYLNPSEMTIPQTNFKIGYYVSDHYNVNIGVDHMKYIMKQYQTVKINGFINDSGTQFDGTYNNQDILLSRSFLTFEHSDGLNYINTEISRVDNILEWLHVEHKNLEVNLTEGVGLGILLPRTNAKLLGQDRNDKFHLAGYGVSLKTGINVTMFRYFFIQAEAKGGYINMNDIKTTMFSSDHASQHFFFNEFDLVFGAIFRIANKH